SGNRTQFKVKERVRPQPESVRDTSIALRERAVAGTSSKLCTSTTKRVHASAGESPRVSER
ncbi:hypothetical protein GOODEAATRI_020695, partial [Goodea atripinnis]